MRGPASVARWQTSCGEHDPAAKRRCRSHPNKDQPSSVAARHAGGRPMRGPDWTRPTMAGADGWTDVGAAAELAATPLRRIAVGNSEIALSFRAGSFGAVANAC